MKSGVDDDMSLKETGDLHVHELNFCDENPLQGPAR